MRHLNSKIFSYEPNMDRLNANTVDVNTSWGQIKIAKFRNNDAVKDRGELD